MGAEAVVLSFLYSLLMSMGLIGGSYADISSAFPDNTAAQNQVLYSVANNPTLSNGGFDPIEHRYDDEVANFFYWFVGTSEFGPFATENWDALMNELGFSVVQNNIGVATDAGFDPEFVGTKSAVVNIGGILGGVYVWGYTDSGSVWGSTEPYGTQGDASAWWDYPVIKLEYNGETRYCTAMKLAAAPEYGVNGGYEGSFQYPPFELWTNDGKLYIRNSRYIPGQITVDTFRAAGFDIPYDDMVSEGAVNVGEDLLGFGATDNPVVGVTYDPATGVTTYKYKDGTTSTTPPAVLGDGVAISPSITQPLTNYIINEGDVTNIFNPDSAIPSEAVPFDFTSLGELLKTTFIPTVAFPYQTIYNRLLNKATFLTVITDLGVKLKNITPKRPEYFIYGVDMFEWIDTIGESNFVKVKNLIAFALKVSMLFGSIALVMKTFHVNVGKGSEG